MRKMYLLAAALISFTTTNAQVSEKNIPANATIVTDINLGKLTSLMSTKEWDKSTMGKELLKSITDKTGKKVKSIEDLGVDLKGHAYIYYTSNDSMNFMSVLMPVADAKKTKIAFAKLNPVAAAQNSWMAVNEDSLGMFIANDKQILFVSGFVNDTYFKKEEVAKNHGIDLSNPYDYAMAATDTVMLADEEGEVTDTAVVMDDEAEETEEAEEMEDSTYYKNQQIKNRIVYKATRTQINDWFYNGFSNSINDNKNYNAVKNNDAVVSFWMDEPMSFYQKLLPSYIFGGNSGGLLSNMMPTSQLRYTGINSHLLMDKKQAEISSTFTMSEEMAELQKKLSGRKANPAFLKYLNMDNAMAYLTYAFDTKAYLENFPQVMESTYGNYMSENKEEISLAAELFSFLIDEEAISKMAPGDAMMVFNGLYQKEVTYSDYTYDEDYNATEVIKKKMETLPKFLMMMTSEQNKLSKKLIEYGIKKEVLKEEKGYYALNIPKSPMAIYVMYKDGILFIGNEEESLQQINNNNFKAKVSAEERDFITNNISSMVIKPGSISKQVSATGLAITEDLTDMMNTLKNMGNMRMSISPVANNQMKGNFTMYVPSNNSNALTYFMSLINGLSKNNK